MINSVIQKVSSWLDDGIICFKRIGDHKLPIPEQAHKGDAGYDLHYVGNKAKVLNVNEQDLFPTGFAVKIPEGYVGFIKARSGISTRLGTDTGAGVIDSGYRGEIHVLMRNITKGTISIDKGTKIAQLVIIPCYHGKSMEVEEFIEETERGKKGFGSTDN